MKTNSLGRYGVAISLLIMLAVMVYDTSNSMSGPINTGNSTPAISGFPNRTINEDGSSGQILFTINDQETPASELTVFATSSNSLLLPSASIVLGGEGSNRTVTLNSSADQYGTTTITVSVSDGQLIASESFLLAVNSGVDVVQNFRYTAAHESAVLYWSPNDETDFYKYYIYADTIPNPTKIEDSTNAYDRNDTIRVYDDLDPGQTYYARIVAVNISLQGSPPSTQLTHTVPVEAPVVTTGPAFGVTATTVTVNGYVNPNNVPTTVSFEYGTTTLYGNATGWQSVDSISVLTPYSAGISGLLPNTVYHYRARGMNAGGTSYGFDVTFKTATLPPVVDPGGTDSVSADAAILTGNVNPNNLLTEVYIEYGTTMSYGFEATALESPINGGSIQEVTFNLENLVPNTEYHFRTIATNTAATVYSSDNTFTTGEGEVTSIEIDPDLPEEFSLAQNYPNPFNPKTDLRYEIRDAGFVVLTIFNVLGKEVAILVQEEKQQGTYIATWNADNTPTGIYYARISVTALTGTQNFLAMRKLVLMK